MKPFLFILAVATLIFMSGCKPDSQPNAAEDAAVKIFEVQGILREVSPDHRTATIQHQKSPGYMPAMTMPFNVKLPQELDGIEIGADITFKLVVRTNEHWIEDIRFVALRMENIPNNRFVSLAYVPRLKEGDVLPDGELLSENGEHLHFTDFRGKAL